MKQICDAGQCKASRTCLSLFDMLTRYSYLFNPFVPHVSGRTFRRCRDQRVASLPPTGPTANEQPESSVRIQQISRSSPDDTHRHRLAPQTSKRPTANKPPIIIITIIYFLFSISNCFGRLSTHQHQLKQLLNPRKTQEYCTWIELAHIPCLWNLRLGNCLGRLPPICVCC